MSFSKIVSTCHFYQKTKNEDKKKHENHKKRLIYEKQICKGDGFNIKYIRLKSITYPKAR